MDWDQLTDRLGKLGSDFGRWLKNIFGSRNERVVRQLVPLVQRINELEAWAKGLSAEQFQEQTRRWKAEIAAGEKTIEDVLPDAFALVREASVRTLGMRHFDVQLVGGVILHRGAIAEMYTGEGKTLVATLPLYLNCLSGKTVYLVTVNDYLARRDAAWMGPIYDYLGVAVGAIQSDMSPWERQPVYLCDIVYGTNSEFGFDYLRDNMKNRLEDQVQKVLSFAIVDEVDSILVDEARTPLIISGPATGSIDKYALADQIARKLKRDEHYEVKEKERQATLKESGIEEAEKMVGVPTFFQPPHEDWPHYIENALRAHSLYQLDKEYVVENGEVIIVDEFTGRKMQGRRWSDGLHQAVEVKEGLPPRQENQTLATITYQNYFRMFEKLAGMTGTAITEAGEFLKIYKLDVLSVPTNMPVVRKDFEDTVFRTEPEKWKAITDELRGVHEKGQPVLVGTTSIEKSEHLSKLLAREGIAHEVLNAKNHEREAHIIARAGEKNAVTVATNMAGRGTDIKLGGNFEYRLNKALEEAGLVLGDLEKLADIDVIRKRVRAQCDQDEQEVQQLGGLYVLGTERHEARRIDNQLRGRSGRQGNAGTSRFYLSLEDDLMRIFYRDWVKNFMQKLGMGEGVPIESGMVTRAIERAQKKVEDRNFEIRKNLLEYDEVMDQQRKTIYGVRQEVLGSIGLKEKVVQMVESAVRRAARETYMGDAEGLRSWYQRSFGIELDEALAQEATRKEGEAEGVIAAALAHYDEREKSVGPDIQRQVERYILLNAVDSRWKDHLYAIDSLKHGIHLRAYAQVDPKNIYKQEGFQLFQKLFAAIEDEVASLVMRIEVRRQEGGAQPARPAPPILGSGGVSNLFKPQKPAEPGAAPKPPEDSNGSAPKAPPPPPPAAGPAPARAGPREPCVRRAPPPAADRRGTAGTAQARAGEDRSEQRRPQRPVSLRQRREVQEVPRKEPLKDSSAPIPPPLVGDPTPGVARFALHLLYDGTWALAFVLFSPWWIVRGILDRRFRALSIARTFGKLPGKRAPGARPRLLVHGVSVGEVKAARPLVEALREQYDIVICTVTDTGQDVARRLYPQLAVVRFPLDFSPLVARFLAGVDPECVILIELELWPSFLRVCNRRGIPLCVANGRITERSYPRYRLFKRLLPQFARISLFCAQDEEYAARFRALGADPARVRVTGNIKADGLKTGVLAPREEIRALLGGRPGQKVLVAGSTHAPEERWLAEACRASVPDARLVLVPRHPERAAGICEELAALGVRAQRLTALRGGEAPDPARPALVDTIGELEQVYALADLVFVGGSLIPHGGQNMLEPAALGRAVVYGPHLRNFLQEAALLERAGASRRLADESELGRAFAELLADGERAQRMGRAGMNAVEAQKGASARTLETLRSGCLEPLRARLRG